jgi:hypothetical protein
VPIDGAEEEKGGDGDDRQSGADDAVGRRSGMWYELTPGQADYDKEHQRELAESYCGNLRIVKPPTRFEEKANERPVVRNCGSDELDRSSNRSDDGYQTETAGAAAVRGK